MGQDAMKKDDNKKAVASVSVIGGADGPTSVWIAGKLDKKDRHVIRRFKHNFRNYIYRQKRNRVEKKIVPSAHSLPETVQYMVNKYGAVETGASDPCYAERRSQMKCALIQRTMPELLGGNREILPPKDLQDEEEVKKWVERMDEWIKSCEEKAEAIPDDVFPTDYHLYVIDKEEGRMKVEIEFVHEILGVSYSGRRKSMNIFSAVSKDIHSYYGVTKEDIEKKSERYSALVNVLSSG